eukprot:superscaffoldBa00001609_g11290
MSLLKQRGRELERFDGLSLIYWTTLKVSLMILSSQKLPELWDYFLIYVSGALEFNPDSKDVDLGLFPLRMNPTIKNS